MVVDGLKVEVLFLEVDVVFEADVVLEVVLDVEVVLGLVVDVVVVFGVGVVGGLGVGFGFGGGGGILTSATERNSLQAIHSASLSSLCVPHILQVHANCISP